MYCKVLSVGTVLLALCSCSGNNDAAQQQAVVPAPASAADTTMAQPQAADPAAAQAAPAAAVSPQSLPGAITAFVKQHFPSATIVGVEPDYDNGGLEYDVYLSDGTQIDFDANNHWDQVESRAKGVPAFFIPKAIATYVRGNFQNMAIAKINKEYYGYEIELANGLELNFDRSGRFMAMDD